MGAPEKGNNEISELVKETEKAEEEKEKFFSWKQITIDEWIGFVIFWILFALILSQVISRYAFNDSITWTEEVSRYLLVSLTFLGLAIGIRRKAHISVQFFYRYLREKPQKALSVFVGILVILFYVLSVFFSWEVGRHAQGQRMSNINVSRSVLYYTVMVGFVFAVIMQVKTVIYKIKNQEDDEEETI